MRFYFASTKLAKLYTDEQGAGKYPSQVVDAFFDVIFVIDGAKDERDLYALKSLHYEKLKGHRKYQRSVRLNKQFRLILERERDENGICLAIVEIDDYH